MKWIQYRASELRAEPIHVLTITLTPFEAQLAVDEIEDSLPMAEPAKSLLRALRSIAEENTRGSFS